MQALGTTPGAFCLSYPLLTNLPHLWGMKPKLKGEITIEQALSEMRARPGTFWLCFVRATGRHRGTFKVVPKCRYGAPQPSGPRPVRGGEPADRKKSLHVDRGTLPMTDHDSGEYLTPLISHIIGYQGKLVVHSNPNDERKAKEAAKQTD